MQHVKSSVVERVLYSPWVRAFHARSAYALPVIALSNYIRSACNCSPYDHSYSVHTSYSCCSLALWSLYLVFIPALAPCDHSFHDHSPCDGSSYAPSLACTLSNFFTIFPVCNVNTSSGGIASSWENSLSPKWNAFHLNILLLYPVLVLAFIYEWAHSWRSMLHFTWYLPV